MSDAHILQALERYIQSINHAEDISLAEALWLCDDTPSMIFPLGKENGWSNIKNNFYGAVMCGRFSSRNLQMISKPEIQLFENFALARFDWEFHAITRADSSERETRGRESQVYIKSDGAWKLLHVHYSQLK